jgi:hypothetical protein
LPPTSPVATFPAGRRPSSHPEAALAREHEAYEQAGPKSHASGKRGPIKGDSRNLWFVALLGTFATITTLAIVFLRDEPEVEQLLSPLWLTLLGLASLRFGRIVALDEVTQPFRGPFVDVKLVKGEWKEIAKPEGLRGAVGALVTSPESIGFWIAGLLVYLFVLWPTVVRMVIIVLAVNGLAELVNAVVHYLARRSHQS